MTISELENITGVGQFLRRVSCDQSITLPGSMSYPEGEYEYFLSKMHGRYCQLSNAEVQEILTVLKKYV